MPRARSIWLKSIFAFSLAIAVWCLVWLSMGARQRNHWAQNMLIPTGILAVACLLAVRYERKWGGPVREFLERVPRIRAGDAAIEELSEIKGGMTQIVPVVQGLFHEIRQQKQAVAELNEEIRQRVAVRTDALERKIGSLRQQAVRDGLTGLYNRRMLDQFLPQLLEKCRADAADLCLMMIDIDNFKELNDTLGHAAGDGLLRDIGRLIRSSVRDHDAAFRYGGDEFVILLPAVGMEAAKSLGDRLISLVDALAKPLRVEKRPRLSIGSATFLALKDPTAQTLLAAADKQLYAIKSARKSLKAPVAMYG